MARAGITSCVAGFVCGLTVLGGGCAGPQQVARAEDPARTPPIAAPEVPKRDASPAAPSENPPPATDLQVPLGVRDLVPPPEGRARAKRAPALGETAFLFVEAEPRLASILVDGVRVGEGQAFLRLRGPRWKVVRVEAPGHEPVEGAVEVREREVVKVRLPLDPVGGRLTVVTDSPGAQAILDGRFAGTTPLTLSRVASGVHHLVLQAGSWRWSGDIEVRTGETRLIEMTIASVVAPAPVAPIPTPPPGPGGDARSTRDLPAASSPGATTPSGDEAARGHATVRPTSALPPPASADMEEPAGTTPGPASPGPSASSGPPSGRPDCEAVCTRFVQAVAGSDSIREPIFNRCRERCRSGDLRFSVCAWKARDMNDVSACMALPE